MTPDQINGLFECIASVLLLLNCRRLYLDKQVKGISPAIVVFYVAWGCWNLVFYPSVGAWWSFYCGIGVTALNALWIGMMLYYKRVR